MYRCRAAPRRTAQHRTSQVGKRRSSLTQRIHCRTFIFYLKNNYNKYPAIVRKMRTIIFGQNRAKNEIIFSRKQNNTVASEKNIMFSNDKLL
jgi:hypothetical protein